MRKTKKQVTAHHVAELERWIESWNWAVAQLRAAEAALSTAEAQTAVTKAQYRKAKNDLDLDYREHVQRWEWIRNSERDNLRFWRTKLHAFTRRMDRGPLRAIEKLKADWQEKRRNQALVEAVYSASWYIGKRYTNEAPDSYRALTRARMQRQNRGAHPIDPKRDALNDAIFRLQSLLLSWDKIAVEEMPSDTHDAAIRQALQRPPLAPQYMSTPIARTHLLIGNLLGLSAETVKRRVDKFRRENSMGALVSAGQPSPTWAPPLDLGAKP